MTRLVVLAIACAAACGGNAALDDAAVGSDAAVPDAPADANPDASGIPGPPVALRFDVQPASSLAGQPLAPSLEVTIVDAEGVPATSAAGPVVLTLDGSGATLDGVVSRNTSLGVATFAGLHVDTPGTGYTITATGDGLPPITSDAFDITFGPPSSLGSTVTASPKILDADGVLATTITVRAANAFGIALPGTPIALAVDGSGNILGASSGVADASGELHTTLASTVAETKTITATIEAATATATMKFVDLCRLAFDGPPLFRMSSFSSASVAGDFDGDGVLDVAAVGDDGAIHVVLGLGVAPREVVTPFVGPFEVVQLLAVDLDHDGKLDLVARTDSADIEAALGRGDGTFGSPVVTTIAAKPFALTTGDFDHDGLPDLAATFLSIQQVAILRGTGTGAFTTTLLPAGRQPTHLAVGDFNADGKLDLVVADGIDFTLRAYLGDGTGGFAAPILSAQSDDGPILTGDLDRDGALDFVVLDSGGGVIPYVGNKAGRFSFGTEIVGLTEPRCVVLGDVTGDDVPDVVTCNGLQVAKGNGDGTFTLGPPVSLVVNVLALVDVDGDAKPDALFDAGGRIGVARNLGGVFEGPSVIAGSRSPIFDVTADFDGDTFTDLAWQGGAQLDRPGGTLVTGPIAPIADTFELAAVADFDGNGAPDLVLASTDSADTVEIVLGNGDGSFHRGGEVTLGVPYAAVATGDFDADGNADVMVVAAQGEVIAFFGDGTGAILPPVEVGFPDNTNEGQIVAADLDGDGATDFVTADGTLGVRVWMSNRDRTFEPPVTLRATFARIGVADLDGDGRLDVVATADTLPAELFRGLGDGTFEAPVETGTDFASDDLRIVDIDGDGVLDLVSIDVGGFDVAQGYGDGTFHAVREQAFTFGGDYAFTDLDRDGRLDVIGPGVATGALAVAHQRACLAK